MKVGLGASSSGSPVKRPDEAARERGLAGAEIAGQRDEVARPSHAASQRASARSPPRRRLELQTTLLRYASETAHVLYWPACILSCAASCGSARAAWVDGKDAGDRACPRRAPKSISHPAAMQFDERPHDRQAEARPAMARADRDGLEAFEHALQHFGRNAAAAIGDLEHDLRRARRIAASVTVWPASEKPIALESRLNSTCRTRRPSARSEPTPSVATMRNSIADLAQPILHAFRRRLHRFGDVDVLQPQLQRAGVDRGEIENVVDDGEQRGRGFA